MDPFFIFLLTLFWFYPTISYRSSQPRTTSYVKNMSAELGTTFIRWTPIPEYSDLNPSSWARVPSVSHMPFCYLKTPSRACSLMRVRATSWGYVATAATALEAAAAQK